MQLQQIPAIRDRTRSPGHASALVSVTKDITAGINEKQCDLVYEGVGGQREDLLERLERSSGNLKRYTKNNFLNF